jgi:ATP-dependent Clp protease ATP-binding subunit ClpB
MHATIKALRRQQPARIVLAVPTAAPETCEGLKAEVDEVICAIMPEPFHAVGLWYEDFSQTTDDEVRDLLARTQPSEQRQAGPGTTETTLLDALRQHAHLLSGAAQDHNPLMDLVGNARFVLLGEASHGTHEFYHERAQITERLIKEKGFTAVAVEDTISILRGLKERYEVHHGVRIKDAALVAAAVLSHRYISDRFLPDKAIDLVDEAAAKLRTEIDSMPTELDEISRRVMQLEIEREALKKETDPASRERLGKLEEELANLKEKADALKAQCEAEKEAVQRLRSIRQQIEQTKIDIEQAERQYDLNRAAELRYGRLVGFERQLQEEEEKLTRDEGPSRVIKEEVDEEDIAEVVSRWTGVPVSKLLEGEIQKLLHLDEELHKRVVGQDEAVTAVAEAVVRARSGLKDPNRPIGSFIFLGPTGVGKTELARALAEFLFDDELAMIRIDMSEYQERHTVARLIGAPPGYVGYDEGGQLTEAVRRRPYCVILFDEIEKAHFDVFNVMLQILDDGRLTDGHGRTVDFKNTIVIMTSNIGSHRILEYCGAFEGEAYERMKQAVLEEMRRHFRPEFLNRVDEIIVFHALSEEHLKQIVEIQLGYLRKRLAERHIQIELTDAAREYLVRIGYDPAYGARPLKRAIQKEVETPMARLILQGEVRDGHKVAVDYDPSLKALRFNYQEEPALAAS